jgi:hypothetical protein
MFKRYSSEFKIVIYKTSTRADAVVVSERLLFIHGEEDARVLSAESVYESYTGIRARDYYWAGNFGRRAIYASNVANRSWSITPSVTEIGEGESITFTVIARGAADGQILHWSVEHITSSDKAFKFSDGQLTIFKETGTFTIESLKDSSSGGDVTFFVAIKTNSLHSTGFIVSTDVLQINNNTYYTSNYAITASSAEFNLQLSNRIVFTVNTVGVVDRTFEWLVSGINVGNLAFNKVKGAISTINGTSNFTIELTENIKSYLPAKFYIRLLEDNIEVARSDNIQIIVVIPAEPAALCLKNSIYEHGVAVSSKNYYLTGRKMGGRVIKYTGDPNAGTVMYEVKLPISGTMERSNW